ncbi:MAG: YncE family protein [Lysobacterales bacterium]
MPAIRGGDAGRPGVGRHAPGVTREVIRRIDVATGQMQEELNPRGGDTCGLAFSPDGKRLLIANQKGGHLYDLQSHQLAELETRVNRID